MPPSSVCPVPIDQRPVNEFRELAQSWFFRWGKLTGWELVQPLLLIWAGSFLISGPVVAASIEPADFPIEFTLLASTGAGILPILTFLRLYLGWRYIRSRLLDPKIFYEESGWYDGQIWQKTPEFMAQDQLIANYEVQPILSRLQTGLLGMLIALVLGTLGWWRLHPWA